MPNIASIMKAHNKQVLAKDENPATAKKNLCPLQGNCQARNIIYNAIYMYNANLQCNTKSQDQTPQKCTCTGLTEPPSKLRYSNHLQSLRHEKYENSTELSKHIWCQKRNGTTSHSPSIGQFPADPRPTAANRRGATCASQKNFPS